LVIVDTLIARSVTNRNRT